MWGFSSRRAAWHGDLVGESYETREEAAEALIERRRHEEAPADA